MVEPMQNSIGIMQGRVVPTTLERLQVFPEQWEQEFLVAKEIGFTHIELLDDKENKLRELLQSSGTEFFGKLEQSGLHCSSVCADQLCVYPLLQNPAQFKKRVSDLLSVLQGHGSFTIVVPFFDENKIHSMGELKKALEELAYFDQELQQKGMRLALEIDLPAQDIAQAFQGFQLSCIGVCYDIGNAMGNGFNVAEEIELLKNYIIHMHVKDKKNGTNVRLGANSEQLGAAFRILQNIGYKGLYTLETCITPDPKEEAQANIAAVKKLIQAI